MRRASVDDLLNPHRVFYKLFRDYSDGTLTNRQHYYRARVEAVDTQGGQLEASPPNPAGSIRGRVYTSGMDSTTPSAALTVFYPMLPAHINTPPLPGEHVYVVFEDENFSSGLWISVVPSFSNLNYANPDFRSNEDSGDSSYAFEGDNPPETSVNSELEYGGTTTNTEGRPAMVDLAESASPNDNFWRDKKVLCFGDSQVAGVFGTFLGRKLTTEVGAASYDKAGRVGWGVISWLRGYFRNGDPPSESIEALIRRYAPDVVIVSLGGNDGASGFHRRRDYEDKVREIWDIVGRNAQHRIWAGPPTTVGSGTRHQPGRERAAQKIKNVVGEQYFVDVFDVTNVTVGRTRDGVHFTAASPALEPWANLIVQKGIQLR